MIEMLSGECGVVGPPKDLEALGKALLQMCADAVLRKAMGVRSTQGTHRVRHGQVIGQLMWV